MIVPRTQKLDEESEHYVVFSVLCHHISHHSTVTVAAQSAVHGETEHKVSVLLQHALVCSTVHVTDTEITQCSCHSDGSDV